MSMREKGFTLFELLVSISIIAILTAMVSLSYSAAQKKARDTKRRQDMEAVQKAAEQFYSLSGDYSYPEGTTVADWTVNGEALLNLFPTDPKGGDYAAYSENFGTDTSQYCVCAAVENISNGNAGVNDCSAFASSGAYFCVKNQQ